MKNLLINLSFVFSLLFCLAFACNDNEGGNRKTFNSTNGTLRSTTDDPASTDYQDAEGPRLGTYQVLSYGADPNNPMRLGHFDLLDGGKYEFYNDGGDFAGEGDYTFDSTSNTVRWSGIFKNNGWGGAFEIKRDGKTHLIRLTRNTIGTNSTDSRY